MPLLVVAPLAPAAPGSEYGWAAWTRDGGRLRRVGSAVPALLPTSAEVTLCVPGAALSWHQVALPPGSLGSAVRLRSLLNGLLEDRLLDEPEMLHFALEPDARAGATVWVAACNRIWLRSVVQALEAAGRRIARIVPEFTPQSADAPPLLVATGAADAARLTVCDAGGVAVLPLTSASLALIGGVADTAVLRAEPGVSALAESVFGQPVPIVQSEARWLQASRSPWDLAQFELASTGRARASKKFSAIVQTLWFAPRWRAARWGALVLVLAQLIGLNAWAWKERSALDAKKVAVRAVLTQTFPGVQQGGEAPAQMAREVAALQQATGGLTGADLEPMLGALASSLPAGRSPSAVDYSAGQLRLRGLGLQPSDEAALAATLASRGYGARLEGDLLLVQADGAR